MGGLDAIEERFRKVENVFKNHRDATIAIAIIIVFFVVAGGVFLFVYFKWYHNPSSSSISDDTTLTPEEEASILKSVAKKMIGTRKYYQLYPIANKYLDSAAAGNLTWDITSGKPTVANKGNCFYSDNEKYAVHIDENSYILLLKAVNAAAGIWEVSKVLYDGDSSNTFTEPYSLLIDIQNAIPANFTASSKTNFTLNGSTPVAKVKAFQPLLTFGAVNASNYRLYIDESSGKVRVRVYGSSFEVHEPANDVEVVAF